MMTLHVVPGFAPWGYKAAGDRILDGQTTRVIVEVYIGGLTHHWQANTLPPYTSTVMAVKCGGVRILASRYLQNINTYINAAQYSTSKETIQNIIWLQKGPQGRIRFV
jgi:hypothetical protein